MNYDKTLKVGDYITTYNPGLFQLTEIIKRYLPNGSHQPTDIDQEGLYSPLFKFDRIYTLDGVKQYGYDRCDASHCKRANIDEFITWFEEIIERWKTIKLELQL